MKRYSKYLTLHPDTCIRSLPNSHPMPTTAKEILRGKLKKKNISSKSYWMGDSKGQPPSLQLCLLVYRSTFGIEAAEIDYSV